MFTGMAPLVCWTEIDLNNKYRNFERNYFIALIFSGLIPRGFPRSVFFWNSEFVFLEFYYLVGSAPR